MSSAEEWKKRATSALRTVEQLKLENQSLEGHRKDADRLALLVEQQEVEIERQHYEIERLRAALQSAASEVARMARRLEASDE